MDTDADLLSGYDAIAAFLGLIRREIAMAFGTRQSKGTLIATGCRVIGLECRRGFLRGLVSLPLIGGGVTLIGAPSAVAEPVCRQLLDTYDTWLLYERCKLKAEKIGPAFYWDGFPKDLDVLHKSLSFVPLDNAAAGFHFGPDGGQPPSARAALVLSAVGVDWREGGR